MQGKHADQIQTQLFLASDFNQTDTVSGMSRCIVQFVLVFTLFIGVHQSHATIDATLQMQLGNPSGATADTNNHNHYLIQRTVEALDYNDSRGQPNWASWDLTSADANSAVTRQDSFATDTNLPGNFYRVPDTGYGGSGFDRGHLCPSADRTDSTNDNDMTFLMSNMIPQAPTITGSSGLVWKIIAGHYCPVKVLRTTISAM